MDEYSSRKAAGELSYSRKASSRLALRDSADNRDRNTQLCSRAGCSSRTNVTKSNQIGSSGKAKTTRHPFHLSKSGKEVVASSSRTPPDPRKSSSDLPKKLPCAQIQDTRISNLSLESEASELVIPNNAQIMLTTPVQNNVSGEASSSNSIPHTRNGKKTMRRPELNTDDSCIGASASRALKNSNNGVRNGTITTKYDFRNFKCNAVNDVSTSSCSSSSSTSLASASSSDLNPDGKKVMGRKRTGEAEGNLHMRGKKINGSLLDDRRNDASRGISISSSRRTRNSTFTMDNNMGSIATQRSAARARLSEQEDRSISRQSESLSTITLLPQPSIPVDTNSSSRVNASRRPASSNRPLDPFDAGFGSSFMNRENVGQYSFNGIAEILQALDRIDQDEELTYERLLLLETNLFLTGLSLSDQHRDMRLDIDNMSYEELLALEERMGTVSTALSEEALEDCIKKSIYYQAEEGTVGEEEEEEEEAEVGNKCSICQEEYEEGNEIGGLGCGHEYHFECVQQWLQRKNWCPICKVSAAKSAS